MITGSFQKRYTDMMEQTLFSPVSPQPMAHELNNTYYSGQAYVTPVSPYEARPDYERESVFSELRAVDSIIDSTVSVLRQFDNLNSNGPHSNYRTPISRCSTYSITSTDSVSDSASVYVPPFQVRDISVRESHSPGSASICGSLTSGSSSSVEEDMPCSPHKRYTPYNKSKKKYMAPGSKEYCDKRERNNVAVRKSRAKAKNRQHDNETRMCELQTENERLTERLESITKELVVLKGLFKNMGATVPVGFSDMFQS